MSVRFTVVTIFPEMLASVLDASLLGRARASGAITVDVVDPRAFTRDRHRTVDDAPYGGGPGMVMKAPPLVEAIESIGRESSEPGEPDPSESSEPEASASIAANVAARPHRILLSPAGAPLTQARVEALAALEHIALVCGRYEGIDDRVAALAIDEELSVGDFVLTGGEIAALAVIDAVARYVPGVLGESASTAEESFSTGLLEYPQYTRPATYRGLTVPAVLTSGDHGAIRRWRRGQSLIRTAHRRPDVLARHRFTDEDRALLAGLGAEARIDVAGRTHIALVHHPVYDRNRDVVTTAVTNLDLHDIARSAATYGLAGYHVVTPVSAQRDKVERILSVWRGDLEQRAIDNRIAALGTVQAVPSIDHVIKNISKINKLNPIIVATSAREHDHPGRIGFAALHREALCNQPDRPILILLGTGFGLTEEIVASADYLLAPVSGRPAFNHLSVRSAAAVILDRLFGSRAD